MVGRDYEAGGIAKDGAKMVTAVACAQVPKITRDRRRLLRRRQLRHVRPRLFAALPVHLAECAHLGDGRRAGGARARDRASATTSRPRARPGAAEEEAVQGSRSASSIEREGNPYYATARLWDDGIIAPSETRRVLALAFSAALNAPRSPETKVRRVQDVDLWAWIPGDRMDRSILNALDQMDSLARERAGGRVPVVGVAGPQGSGKTTLVMAHAARGSRRGALLARRCLSPGVLPAADGAGVCIRCWRRAGRRARTILRSSTTTLDACRRPIRTRSSSCPGFDKVDRQSMPPGRRPSFRGRPTVILVDGWCLGAEPQTQEALAASRQCAGETRRTPKACGAAR